MEGKHGPNTFLPLKHKNWWTGWIHQRKRTICLMEDQARHVCKKTESGSIINVDTIQQEIYQDIGKIDDTNVEVNPYC